jgi:predicted site-specific integrase-resolvase
MAAQVLRAESVSLRQWAENTHICYKTAWRMFRDGRLPKHVRAERLPTGTIRLYTRPNQQVLASDPSSAVIYARIHPRQLRDTLETQISSCKAFCHSHGWIVTKVVREITAGSGLSRRKLRKLLDNPPGRLVVLRQTVISRFDFALVDECLRQIGCSIVVIDQSDEQEPSIGSAVLADLIDAISHTCRRRYGQKRGALLIESLEKLIRTKTL